ATAAGPRRAAGGRAVRGARRTDPAQDAGGTAAALGGYALHGPRSSTRSSCMLYARRLNNPPLVPTFSGTLEAFQAAILSGDIPQKVVNSLQLLLKGYALGLSLAMLATALAMMSSRTCSFARSNPRRCASGGCRASGQPRGVIPAGSARACRVGTRSHRWSSGAVKARAPHRQTPCARACRSQPRAASALARTSPRP